VGFAGWQKIYAVGAALRALNVLRHSNERVESRAYILPRNSSVVYSFMASTTAGRSFHSVFPLSQQCCFCVSTRRAAVAGAKKL